MKVLIDNRQQISNWSGRSENYLMTIQLQLLQGVYNILCNRSTFEADRTIQIEDKIHL
ncbi:hypothetical protein [Terribacillus saccharophilus]|uniref:hypothetical protein n=1 Tax=Terribacillus saccharophilus TaxID=361277 RepID=UPI003183391E